MNKIFAGLIFLLVKLNLLLFGIPIVIFPDFVAYIFIYFGLLELSVTEPLFKKSLKPSFYLIIYNLFVLILNLVPQITYNGFAFAGILKLISGLATAYIFYIIILGLQEYGKKASVTIETKGLKKRWTVYSVTVMASPFFRILTYNDFGILSNFWNGYFREEAYASLGYIAIAVIYGIICWFVLAYFTAEFNRVRVSYNASRFAR